MRVFVLSSGTPYTLISIRSPGPSSTTLVSPSDFGADSFVGDSADCFPCGPAVPAAGVGVWVDVVAEGNTSVCVCWHCSNGPYPYTAINAKTAIAARSEEYLLTPMLCAPVFGD